MSKKKPMDKKTTEKEKVLPVTSMGMKSFMGKNLSSDKKEAKPGLFDKFKPKGKGSKDKKK